MTFRHGIRQTKYNTKLVQHKVHWADALGEAGVPCEQSKQHLSPHRWLLSMATPLCID